MAASWYAGLRLAPTDEHMGDVYRIIYVHVPSAFTAFASAFALLVTSIACIRNQGERWLDFSKAVAEVGLLFTVLCLATGSIWGKPTWGTWWTWDARLTTTFLLGILYTGWLILHSSWSPGPQRMKICGALGILIAADVPVIYQSVNWWRTLHQPQSIVRSGGSTMAPEMLQTLMFSVLAMLLFAAWLSIQRFLNLTLRGQIESASYKEMK
jgi:heme exporter protein C